MILTITILITVETFNSIQISNIDVPMDILAQFYKKSRLSVSNVK